MFRTRTLAFIGRTGERVEVDAPLADARGGVGSVLVVHGKAGIGKTVPRFRGAANSAAGKTCGDLLHEPGVPVRIGEGHEGPVAGTVSRRPRDPVRDAGVVEYPAGVVEHLADLHAAAGQVGSGRLDVVDDQVQALCRTGLGSPGSARAAAPGPVPDPVCVPGRPPAGRTARPAPNRRRTGRGRAPAPVAATGLCAVAVSCLHDRPRRGHRAPGSRTPPAPGFLTGGGF